MKFYVMKLIAPRPTFACDMSADERALMQKHALFWRERMAEGKVIVFGPVMDPAGPYGIGIVRLEDGVEPKAFWERDPVIVADCGFTVEVAPMVTAVLAT